MRHTSKKTDLDLWFNDPIFAVLYSAIFFKLLVNEQDRYENCHISDCQIVQVSPVLNLEQTRLPNSFLTYSLISYRGVTHQSDTFGY